VDVAPAGDGFYLGAEHVWVAGVDPQEWPLRQGDLLAAPPAAEDPWLAALLVQVTVERRVGTMSHEARVSFIRRYLYFRFRLLVPFAQVLALEAARIAVDGAFVGDKPGWVTRRCCRMGPRR